MRIKCNNQRGGILVVLLIMVTIMGTVVASYIKLTSAQNASIARSQTWNAVIPVCEAGIEEAMSQVNSIIGTNYAVNGWVLSSNYFTLTRNLADGKYSVRVSTNTFPTIYSTGYLTDPVSKQQVSRTVKVTTTRFSTGMKGIVAKDNLVMTGITVVDSFDSEDSRFSTRGRYDPAKHKDGGFVGAVNGSVSGATVYGNVATGPSGAATGDVGDFGWLAGNTGIEPGHYANDLNLAFPVVQPPFSGGGLTPLPGTMTLTNFDYWSTMITTDIYPATPPASPITTNNFGSMTVTNYPASALPGTVTFNTTPVRSKTMPTAGTYLNLELKGAWYYYDQITSYTYPVRTYTYSMSAPSASTSTDSYDYVLTFPQYQMSALSLSGSQKLLVYAPTTLYVTGDFNMTGNSKIIIAPNGSLKLYVAGNTSLAGNGIFNYTLDASKMMYYGLPSNKSISITGNATFTGAIYAPAADIQLGGGGTDIYDVLGAIVGKSVLMNGHFQFHYDERLGRSKVQSKFTVASWEENTWPKL
jgi:hypothetical protein